MEPIPLQAVYVDHAEFHENKAHLGHEWMTCDFMSFSTVFQSYQGDEHLIMKGLCAMEPHLQLKRFLP